MEQANYNPEYTANQRNTIGLEKGKLPPQAVDLEQAVLGAMMIDKKGLDEVIDILTPQVFYRPEHQAIYAVIQKLFNDSEPIDLLTVSNELKKDGKLDRIGGDYYLIQLTQKVSSSAHVEYYARVIQEKYILRRLIEISNQVIEKSYDDTADVFDLLDYSESKLFEITEGGIKRSYSEAKTLVLEAVEKIKSQSNLLFIYWSKKNRSKSITF